MRFTSSKIIKVVLLGLCVCLCKPLCAAENSSENVQVPVENHLLDKDEIINQENIQNKSQADTGGLGNEPEKSNLKPHKKRKSKKHHPPQPEENKGQGTTNNGSNSLLDPDHPGPDTQEGTTHNGSNSLLESH